MRPPRLREKVQVSVWTVILLVYCYGLEVIAGWFKIAYFLGVSAPSSSLKDQASTDPHDSDAEKSEGTPLREYFGIYSMQH